jgi:hypothetical protein
VRLATAPCRSGRESRAEALHLPVRRVQSTGRLSIKLVRHVWNRSLGRIIRAALQRAVELAAAGEVVVTMDTGAIASRYRRGASAAKLSSPHPSCATVRGPCSRRSIRVPALASLARAYGRNRLGRLTTRRKRGGGCPEGRNSPPPSDERDSKAVPSSLAFGGGAATGSRAFNSIR